MSKFKFQNDSQGVMGYVDIKVWSWTSEPKDSKY